MEALSSVAMDRTLIRLHELWERTGDLALHRLSVGGQIEGPLEDLELLEPEAIEPAEVHSPQFNDWISTALMNCFKNTSDQQVFGLLFELNQQAFAQAIRFQLRRGISRVDANDVLQEVFLNVYRYPHRFQAVKPESFRNWGHRIVRNTLLKFLKRETRRSRLLTCEEDLSRRPDSEFHAPDREAANAEIAGVVDRAFVLYLNLYWMSFRKLSAREQRALKLVEIDGVSYKDAAADLGIRLENLKMVIFRGRRKVLRGMGRSLQHFEPCI